MKNHYVTHRYQKAKIYSHYYKPSLNVFRLLKSIIAVMITGSSPATATSYKRK
jgi:hypothetical protein